MKRTGFIGRWGLVTIAVLVIVGVIGHWMCETGPFDKAKGRTIFSGTVPVNRVKIGVYNNRYEVVVQDFDRDGDVDIIAREHAAEWEYTSSDCTPVQKRNSNYQIDSNLQEKAENLMKAAEEFRKALAESERATTQPATTTRPANSD
jgi:hypothetical protein